MTTRRTVASLVLLLFLGSVPAHAALITYDLTALGGSHYRYDYTVTNDGSITSEVALFDILFDPLLYDESSLSIVSDPILTADWDQLMLGSGILISAAFDALALGDGIHVGESVSGFAVEFTWIGTGLPGIQLFEIYDADTFDLLGGGASEARASVPEPSTIFLLGFGLIALAWTTWRKPGFGDNGIDNSRSHG